MAMAMKARKKKKMVVKALAGGMLSELVYVGMPVMMSLVSFVYSALGIVALDTRPVSAYALVVGYVAIRLDNCAGVLTVLRLTPWKLYGLRRRLIYCTSLYAFPSRCPPVLCRIVLMLFCMWLEWKNANDHAKFCTKLEKARG